MTLPEENLQIYLNTLEKEVFDFQALFHRGNILTISVDTLRTSVIKFRTPGSENKRRHENPLLLSPRLKIKLPTNALPAVVFRYPAVRDTAVAEALSLANLLAHEIYNS